VRVYTQGSVHVLDTYRERRAKDRRLDGSSFNKKLQKTRVDRGGRGGEGGDDRGEEDCEEEFEKRKKGGWARAGGSASI